MGNIEGFENLVKLVQKEMPMAKAKDTKDMWNKFLRIIFLGGGRGEPEISYLLYILKKETDYEFVLKTRGEQWQEAVNVQLEKTLKKENDERKVYVIAGLKKELWKITASIKGSARYFERVKMSPHAIERLCKDSESTWEFIQELSDDHDVTNIRFTKIILWLHSVGFGQDFCPPSRQIKDFVNKDLEFRYQFYEDDKFFMEKIKEFSQKFKNASVYDVSKAIFFFRALKNMMNPHSMECRKFNPSALMDFMKKNKFSLADINDLLSDFDMKDSLPEQLHKFMARRK
ncbi:MAG: hypothetical protein QMD85_04135 [Candidatus Aenigmarchaeota archaeon]|nr:hypothetical protein [Candidatus Aenigmarchaeota archaeon]MDI6722755.1 hypothetical protein [Candidatus Aenigmarchaeota archaeon]